MMRIKYIKDEPLQIFKKNYKYVYGLMKENPNKQWMTSFFGKDFLGDSKIKGGEVEFLITDNKPIEDDLENSIRIFEVFKHLTESQATDERFWVGLSLTQGYDYLLHRWGLDADTKIKYRWIFYTKNRRALFYHGLARLWWYAKLTYDEKRDDPYELTRFAYSHPEILKNMVYRNFSNSKNIRHSIIEGLMKYERDGENIIYDKLVELYKYISYLGGVYILDSYSKDDLIKKVYLYLSTL